MILLALLAGASAAQAVPPAEGNDRRRLLEILAPWPEAQKLVKASRYLGLGNRHASQHPATEEACRRQHRYSDRWKKVCPGPYMAPIGDPKKPAVCIDRFEFPGLPCTYPVVWARAQEAEKLCRAVGKRLCDAHEWESACAGDPPKRRYAYQKRGQSAAAAHSASAKILNPGRRILWAYGETRDLTRCATGVAKSPGCDRALASGKIAKIWAKCGSQTYPSGMFPQCATRAGVHDQHGNGAEHMNLPLKPEQLTSLGGTGRTEMKGSWFFFGRVKKVHSDDCYWRAPAWHGAPVDSPRSHRNYHLTFRCCANPRR